MLAWWSSSETITSSPALNVAPKLAATRLIASVAPLVKTISLGEGALTRRATEARAASNASVVSLARVCSPRWTLA